jgi:hypothetical protein
VSDPSEKELWVWRSIAIDAEARPVVSSPGVYRACGEPPDGVDAPPARRASPYESMVIDST